MNDRSYEDAADEFEKLNFFRSLTLFADCFSRLSHGELLALRSRFVQLAYLEHETEDDERKSADLIAQAIEEVIVFNLKGDPTCLNNYLEARNAEFEMVENYGIGTIAYDLLRKRIGESA